MFDRFEPFQRMKKQSFTFLPNRYEVWEVGKMIDSGNTSLPINARVVAADDAEKVKVIIQDENLFDIVSEEHLFDEFVSGNDRLQLVTIPGETNANSVGMMGMQMIIGATRAKKDFTPNEAYCCNLFLQKGEIRKITFSFGAPEKLVEFYAD